MSETLAEFYKQYKHLEHDGIRTTDEADDFIRLVLKLIKAEVERKAARPPIVCLCGSTRFMDEYFEQGWEETLVGKIVLSVGVCKHTDADGGHGGEMLGPAVCSRLDELHLRKIDLADEVLILNVGGYIGESTARELAYARKTGKTVRFLEPETQKTETERKPDRTLPCHNAGCALYNPAYTQNCETYNRRRPAFCDEFDDGQPRVEAERKPAQGFNCMPADWQRENEPERVVCVRCRQPIGCEGETYYLGGEGMVHVACVPKAERKPPVSLDKDAAEIMRLRAELADKDDALARLTGKGLYVGGPPPAARDA